MITLNTFPVNFSLDADIIARSIPYSEDQLKNLRLEKAATHVFYREGDKILYVSSDYNNDTIGGEEVTLKAADNFKLVKFLIKDSITRLLKKMNRKPTERSQAIEIISTKPEDNVLTNIVEADFPFSIFGKYELGMRFIRGKIHLVIDYSTKRNVTQPCHYFINKNFNIVGRYITQPNEEGFNKFLGIVSHIEGDKIHYKSKNGEAHSITSNQVFLEANLENFSDYAKHIFDLKESEKFLEKIRIKSSEFNSGPTKKDRISKIKNFLNSEKIRTLNGMNISFGEAFDISNDSELLKKPFLVFNDNGEVTWTEKGLKDFGPYTKRTFDRNNPSICVICSEQQKGSIEQFIRKFLKGIPGHKNFSAGFEGKFQAGTSRVKLFTFNDESVESYKKAIGEAIVRETQDNKKWDLALVQVKQSFKSLSVESNPYYIGKSLFFLHQIPVQDFTLELLSQSDYGLGYSLNNMALAAYAKMGGVPWLLKSSPTLSHELVIGIGSANLIEDRFAKNQRIMGITTVFSGDGSYIVSNASTAVNPDKYSDALTDVLRKTIDKIKTQRNWQVGDTIRIIFHASVKKFNSDEINAIKAVVGDYKDYNVEYAFLKVSEYHNLHMFDSSTSNDKKGKFAPARGKTFKLSDNEMLIYLIGQNELRQDSDGHPRGLIISNHKESSFKDLKYLSTQLFNFSAHSWRSYFANPLPVTISYSDLIARNLGWLDEIPNWNSSIMLGKIGQTQWFL